MGLERPGANHLRPMLPSGSWLLDAHRLTAAMSCSRAFIHPLLHGAQTNRRPTPLTVVQRMLSPSPLSTRARAAVLSIPNASATGRLIRCSRVSAGNAVLCAKQKAQRARSPVMRSDSRTNQTITQLNDTDGPDSWFGAGSTSSAACRGASGSVPSPWVGRLYSARPSDPAPATL